jgi:hypothetical protein
MRIDIGSVIEVLRTAIVTDEIIVLHEGRNITLGEYLGLLEAAHADPTQHVRLTFTPERIGVIGHEAGE